MKKPLGHSGHMVNERIYCDVEQQFGVRIPLHWLADTSGRAGTRVAFVSPESVMGFQANVNVIAQYVPPLTRDEYLTLSRLQLKLAARATELPVDEPDQKSSVFHVFEWTNNQAPIPVRVRQQIFFSDRKAFVVTATALESNFEEYRATFQSVFDSFKVEDERGKVMPA